MYIYKAAVVGAGAMGAGIAQVLTYSGLPVILKDLNQVFVDRGLQSVLKIYQGRVSKGKMTTTEMDQKMALISGATDYSGFSDVDCVIEAVPEDMGFKQALFSELERVCPPSTIFATNTSSLSVSAIQSVLKKPGRLIGMHFFNPAPVMKLIEVIPGIQTASDVVDDMIALAESLRKIPIRVQDCPGFLVNRLLMPYLNEATLMFQERAMTPQEIDAAVVAFGMPMGPLMLMDMIGLDVDYKVSEILYDAYGPRMKPSSMLKEMVHAGRFGIKSGYGFYKYADDGGTLPIAETTQITHSVPVHRMILPLINEAVIALQEGVATAQDIDVAMMAGVGFPEKTGGPLHYADQIGLDRVLFELQEWTVERGDRFWPAPLLKRMVAGGMCGVKSKRGFFTY